MADIMEQEDPGIIIRSIFGTDDTSGRKPFKILNPLFTNNQEMVDQSESLLYWPNTQDLDYLIRYNNLNSDNMLSFWDITKKLKSQIDRNNGKQNAFGVLLDYLLAPPNHQQFYNVELFDNENDEIAQSFVEQNQLIMKQVFGNLALLSLTRHAVNPGDNIFIYGFPEKLLGNVIQYPTTITMNFKPVFYKPGDRWKPGPHQFLYEYEYANIDPYVAKNIPNNGTITVTGTNVIDDNNFNPNVESFEGDFTFTPSFLPNVESTSATVQQSAQYGGYPRINPQLNVNDIERSVAAAMNVKFLHRNYLKLLHPAHVQMVFDGFVPGTNEMNEASRKNAVFMNPYVFASDQGFSIANDNVFINDSVNSQYIDKEIFCSEFYTFVDEDNKNMLSVVNKNQAIHHFSFIHIYKPISDIPIQNLYYNISFLDALQALDIPLTLASYLVMYMPIMSDTVLGSYQDLQGETGMAQFLRTMPQFQVTFELTKHTTTVVYKYFLLQKITDDENREYGIWEEDIIDNDEQNNTPTVMLMEITQVFHVSGIIKEIYEWGFRQFTGDIVHTISNDLDVANISKINGVLIHKPFGSNEPHDYAIRARYVLKHRYDMIAGQPMYNASTVVLYHYPDAKEPLGFELNEETIQAGDQPYSFKMGHPLVGTIVDPRMIYNIFLQETRLLSFLGTMTTSSQRRIVSFLKNKSMILDQNNIVNEQDISSLDHIYDLIERGVLYQEDEEWIYVDSEDNRIPLGFRGVDWMLTQLSGLRNRSVMEHGDNTIDDEMILDDDIDVM